MAMSMRFEGLEPAYSSGDSIKIKLQFENTGPSPVTLNQRFAPGANHARPALREIFFEVKGPKGSLPFLPKIRIDEAKPSDLKPLAPGSFVASREVDLARSFDLSGPGTYEVQAFYESRSGEEVLKLATGPRSFRITKVEVGSTKKFACPELPEVSFHYPIFKGWEPRLENAEPGRGCVVVFKNPTLKQYELARQLRVTKHSGDTKLEKTLRNPAGIPYHLELQSEHATILFLGKAPVLVEIHGEELREGFDLGMLTREIIASFATAD